MSAGEKRPFFLPVSIPNSHSEFCGGSTLQQKNYSTDGKAKKATRELTENGVKRTGLHFLRSTGTRRRLRTQGGTGPRLYLRDKNGVISRRYDETHLPQWDNRCQLRSAPHQLLSTHWGGSINKGSVRDLAASESFADLEARQGTNQPTSIHHRASRLLSKRPVHVVPKSSFP